VTENDKLERLAIMTGDNDYTVLSTYLSIAGEKILNKAFPFGTDLTEVPDKYSNIQLEIACYLINKRGAEGETSHNENGINRSYESADVPSSMLRYVIPHIGTIHEST